MSLFPEEQDVKDGRLKAFKGTAYKYGIAMIVLVLNNLLSGFLFAPIAVIPAQLMGFDLSEGSDARYIVLMIVNELSAYVLPVLIIWAMFARERAEFIADRTYERIPAESFMLFLAGVAAGSVGSLLTKLINEVIDAIFKTGKIPDAFDGMTPDDPIKLAAFSVCICIIAPVCEEFIFRDLLLKPLRRFHDMTAAVISALIFGLYHGNFDQFAYAALLGFFYAAIAVRANSIVPSTICHAINNFIVCAAAYMPSALPDMKPAADAAALFLDFILPAEIIAGIFVISKGCLSLHSHDRFIAGREGARLIFGSPAVIIGIFAMLAPFFL